MGSLLENPVLVEFGEWIRSRFGARVRALALFGSRARGDASEDSDVDVFVEVDHLSGAESREIAHHCGDLLTVHDVLLVPFAVSTEYFEHLRARERLIVSEIARDGVSL